LTGSYLLFGGGGIFLILVALPLMMGKVPPNAVYGLRVPETLGDEDVWYLANAKAGRELAVVGATVAATATIVYVVPGMASGTRIGICSALLGLGITGVATRGWVYAARLGQKGDDR